MNDHIQNEYTPNVVTPPGVTLREMLDAFGMTSAELADRIGKNRQTIIDITKHGSPISLETAVELEKALGAPAAFWNSRERRYRESMQIHG